MIIHKHNKDQKTLTYRLGKTISDVALAIFTYSFYTYLMANDYINRISVFVSSFANEHEG